MSPNTDRRMPPRQTSVSRMEEKKRARQRRQRKRRMVLAGFVAVLCVLSFVLGRVTAPKAVQNGEKGGGSFQVSGQSGGSRESQAGFAAEPDQGTEASQEPDSADMELYIASHPDEYPQHLRDFLEGNPEALEFVYSYPEYKNLKQDIDISGECRKGEIPLFIQWDKRWGYEQYGDDIIALSGCGPVCLSMVYVGLTGDTSMDPKAMAEFSMDSGYYLENVGTSWDLMSSGAEALGLSWENPSLSRNQIYELLDAGCPLICSMRPGDFTATGHFIVIYGRDGEDLLVHDPNSLERSERTWTYDELEWQVKNIWAYSL